VSGERLGYVFDPVPSWIQAEHEAGSLSDERRDVLLALVHRANVGSLRQGRPTPELRIETLAHATHRPTDRASLDALRRLLGRMRRDRQLAYTTRGGRDRVVYMFTVTLDRSGVSPGNHRPSVPGSAEPRDESPTGLSTDEAMTRSGKVSTANTCTGPGEASSSPGNDHPSAPLTKPDSAEAETAPGPGCPDVRENPSTSWTEAETSAGARENDLDEEALFDRLWAESSTSSRGYGWEPGP
jgi:hypothetical protein